MTKEEALEELGQCIDTVENLMFSMKLAVNPTIHLNGLKGSLPSLRERMKKAYLALGGDDVWSD